MEIPMKFKIIYLITISDRVKDSKKKEPEYTNQRQALVPPAWLQNHQDDPDYLIESALQMDYYQFKKMHPDLEIEEIGMDQSWDYEIGN